MQTHVRIYQEDYEKLKLIKNSISSNGTLLDTLHCLIKINYPEKKSLTLVNLVDSDFTRLKQVQADCGFISVGDAIHSIMKSQVTEVVSPEKIMKDTCPNVLTSRPLAGKTFWCMNTFLKSLNNYCVIVIDGNSEYTFLKEIKSPREIDLNTVQQVRFCPQQHSVMSTLQVKSFFTELNMMLDMNKDALKNVILVIEEAQS